MTAKMYGFWATHPGEVLKDEIEYRGISQKELATQMGMPWNDKSFMSRLDSIRHLVAAL